MGNLNHDTDSENEINEAQHSNLLAAVAGLDVKQRVKPPSRKESSYQVSEFHLMKGASNRKDVEVHNLTKSLNKYESLAAIGKKLSNIRKTTAALPTPLEKPEAARVRRSVGFQKVRSELGRWDAVVESNRASEHLTFPLVQTTVEFQTTNDFISRIKNQTRTPLEEQMDAVLNNSPAVQEERKEEEEIKLSLEEMRERRREMARLRARQSYAASKAKLHSKIKSKKFHRIRKRERVRQQIKDFEALQKTDPEAALQQLEQLERTRAQERISLRHRNTGKWARNKAVRAKYDKESRQELAQQLVISRDLTQKVRVVDSSDEEQDKSGDEATPTVNEDNPWISQNASDEVKEFVNSYRKFWEEHNKESEEKANNLKPMNENESNENIAHLETTQEPCEQEDLKVGKVFKEGNVEDKSKDEKDVSCEQDLVSKKEPSGEINTCSSELADNVDLLREKKFPKDVAKQKKQTKKSVSEFNKKDVVCTATNDAWVITPIKTNKKEEKKKNVENANSQGEEVVNKKEVDIDRLFDKMEKCVKKKVKTKLKRVRAALKETEIKAVNTMAHSDVEGPSLKMKRTVVRPIINEELLEGPSKDVGVASSDPSVSELVAQSGTQPVEPENSSNNIDPNRFIAMKPKHLRTELPAMVTEGDEAIDDNEEGDVNEERQNAISEAFADDDVVADFRKEKEEEEEKSKPKDVDLSLPGWGEWGGKNITVSHKKKKHFTVKFRNAPKRKDANKGNLIINEEQTDKVKVHQVSDLPFPFTSVKDFEASIRAPIGNTWIPESAFRRLTRPQVITRMGKIINPMDEDVLLNKKIIVRGFP